MSLTAASLAASVTPGAREDLDRNKSSIIGGLVIGFLVRKALAVAWSAVLRLLPWLLTYLAVFLLDKMARMTLAEIATMITAHKAEAATALPAPYLSPEP